jgi:protein-tyrosine phosphatase
MDDGPNDLEESLEMARSALGDGIETVVATPHVNVRYGVEPESIRSAVGELNAELEREGLPLSVLGGAEIAFSRIPGLDDQQLRELCLGRSTYALLESPYNAAGALVEEAVFSLKVRGFRPVLAHPERCPEFQRDVARLERLVEGGVACSISAGSIRGQFGEPVKRFAFQLLRRGLVHNVSTDAHSSVRRPPVLRTAFRGSGNPFATSGLQRWLTDAVPAAILADEPLPPAPRPAPSARWRRLISRG